MPSTTSLFKESKQVPIPVESVDTNVPDLLLSSTQDLSDTLFFIQFTPAGTMLRKWYLVQIDLESTLVVNPDYATNGEYWCVFLARHSADKQKSDEFSRWWPEWHSYKRCSVSNDIIYGDRFEFRPSSTPPSTKYIQWSTLLPITGDKSTALVGPFTFAPINTSNRVRQTVAYDHWQSLIVACNFHGLLPPTVGIKSSHRIPARRLQPSRNSTKRKMPLAVGKKKL